MRQCSPTIKFQNNSCVKSELISMSQIPVPLQGDDLMKKCNVTSPRITYTIFKGILNIVLNSCQQKRWNMILQRAFLFSNYRQVSYHKLYRGCRKQI